MRFMGIYVALIVCLGWLFLKLPGSFLPNEDQGIMFLMVNTPPGSTLERTLDSVKEIESQLLEQEGDAIDHLFMVAGFSFAGSAC